VNDRPGEPAPSPWVAAGKQGDRAGPVHVVDVRGRTELERLEDQPFCWWSLDEIAASEETFAPRDLDGSAR